MSLNLGTLIPQTQRFFPDAVALIHDERRMNYTELAARVSAFAAHLSVLGVTPGDKVALFSQNGMSFTVAYFGILHAGATVVPISFLAVGREVAYYLDDSDAVALVANSTLADPAHTGFLQVDGCKNMILFDDTQDPIHIVDGPEINLDGRCDIAARDPNDTAVILYTSGTTGQPKGAELSQFNMYSNAQYSSERLLGSPADRKQLGPGDVVLSALPLFHSFGQTCNQNAAMFGGAAITYMTRFSAEAALEVMARDRVTLFAGVPTMYFELLHFENADQYDLSALERCCSGGAAMPVEVMREFDEKYGVKILEGYGLSETSPVATFNVMWKPRKPGSIGEQIYGCEVKVFDDQDQEVPDGEAGEIVIRGFNVMKGYYKKPEATAEAFRNGWFHSGDIARRDEDGYFFIVDRKKDLIIRNGFNVYPREVEEVLYTHPAVAEAAVIGIPDTRMGEEIKAFIALKADSTASSDEIREFCKRELSATKYPRQIEILDTLPKGSTGKILRRALRDE